MQIPPGYQTSVFLFPPINAPSFISFPPISATFGASPFTVAAWVNLFGIDPQLGDNILSLQDGPNTIPLLQNFVSFSRPFLRGIWSDGSVLTPIDLGNWHYLALTWDGTWLVLYVDGVATGQAKTQPSPLTNPVFQIGYNAPPSGPGSLIGHVRTFAYWNALLDFRQIGAQMWSQIPQVTDGLLSFCAFTTLPPTVAAGPAPQYVGALTTFPLVLESNGLVSQGTDLALPGEDSKLNPSAAAPFSILAWIAAGNTPSFAVPGQAPIDATGVAQGCLFSNGDATDPGNMAISFVNGAPTVTFGSGETITGTQTVPELVWTSIGVTYDGDICTIYVNGSMAGKGAVETQQAPKRPTPALLGQFQKALPKNGFTGMLRSMSVWSVALSPRDVVWYLENDPSAQMGCVANFVCSMNPSQDLVPLDDAVWGDNLVLLGSGMSWQTTGGIFADPSPSPRLKQRPPRSFREQSQPPIVRIRVPRVQKTKRGGPVPEAELRARMRRDFQRAASSIDSDLVRARMSKEFERELDSTFRRAAAGELPELCTFTGSGGSYTLWLDLGAGKKQLATITGQPVMVGDRTESILTFYSPSGEIFSRVQVDLSASCFIWWVSFVLSVILGFLKAAGLPTPEDEIERIVVSMLGDAEVFAVLGSFEGLVTGAIVAGDILYFLKIVYDHGYLGEIVGAVVSEIDWWTAVFILTEIVELTSVVPNPAQAVFIIKAAAAVAQLVLLLVEYDDKCGQSH